MSTNLTQRAGAAAMPAARDGEPGRGAAAGQSLLFLREEEMRMAQDLLFFGYRDFTAGADAILGEFGMGRAHHRVLHFLGRRPGMTVGELLSILGITKQSLSRVLAPLVAEGFVGQVVGRGDRRQRLLSLTEKGEALERRLFERQRETVLRAYREAGPAAVEGFRSVMRGLMTAEARRVVGRLGPRGEGRVESRSDARREGRAEGRAEARTEGQGDARTEAGRDGGRDPGPARGT